MFLPFYFHYSGIRISIIPHPLLLSLYKQYSSYLHISIFAVFLPFICRCCGKSFIEKWNCRDFECLPTWRKQHHMSHRYFHVCKTLESVSFCISHHFWFLLCWFQPYLLGWWRSRSLLHYKNYTRKPSNSHCSLSR